MRTSRQSQSGREDNAIRSEHAPNQRRGFSRGTAGFSLIELLVCSFILLILLSAALSLGPTTLLQRAIDAEDSELSRLETSFTLSLESSDFNGTNLSAIPGELPTGGFATAFSSSLAIPTGTAANDWFAKLAKVQGIIAQIGVAPTRAAQPALAKILLNGRDNPRYCFVAPAEDDRQRFILCSILGETALTLPSNCSDPAFFDALWNADFNTNALGLPGYWITNLTAPQQAAWTGAQGGGSNLPRVRLRRITIPKFSVTVNNNHPTSGCWVYWNEGGKRLESLPGTGVTPTATSAKIAILEGRQVVVKIGATELAALEKYRINLRKNTSVTVE
jgi:prepilin-type N-terminal cleavage/methylation domain-containing protein